MRKSQNQVLARSYAYDSLNRLRYATTNGVSSGQYQQDYQYDAYTGNLLSRSDMGTYTYATSKPHAVSSAVTNTYVYDSNGNMTHRNVGNTQWEYTYDAENRLFEVEKDGVTENKYYYDGVGNRVAWLDENNKGTVFIGNYFEAVYPHFTIPDPPAVTEGGGGENEPSIGRFMQADTIVPMASQGTQAFDRYAYVNNNPLMLKGVVSARHKQ